MNHRPLPVGVLGVLMLCLGPLAHAEKVSCEGKANDGQKVSVTIKPEGSGDLEYLRVAAKVGMRPYGGTYVSLVRTKKGLTYRDMVNPKDISLAFSTEDLPNDHTHATLTLYRGSVSELQFKSLHCSVKGELLKPVAPCPNDTATSQKVLWDHSRQGSLVELENLLGTAGDDR